MTTFTTFVSRRLAAAITVFVVVAALAVGYVALSGGSAPASPNANAGTVDAVAVQAALDDPGNDAADSGRSQLRSDLKAAFKLEGDARRDALAKIRQQAQDGAYGDRIERRADRRQIHHDLFLSLLPDNLQSDLARLKDAPADQREQLRAEIMDKAVAGDYGPDVQKAAEQLKGLRKS
jgi:hypothetical protein